MTMPELTTAAEVKANARRVQARIAASRPMARPKPIMTKVEAPPPPQTPQTPAIFIKQEQRADAVERRLTDIEQQISEWRAKYPEVELQHTIANIIRTVCTYYDVSRRDILSIRRTANVVRPRQVAVYLAKTLTGKSFPEIGRCIRRDHTTVLHSVRKITALRASDPKLDADLTALEAKLMPAVSAVKQRNMEVEA